MEPFYLAYTFTSQFITEGSQGRISWQELEAETNDGMLLTCLLSGSHLITYHILPASFAQEWCYPGEAAPSHTNQSQVTLVHLKLTRNNHHIRFTQRWAQSWERLCRNECTCRTANQYANRWPCFIGLMMVNTAVASEQGNCQFSHTVLCSCLHCDMLPYFLITSGKCSPYSCFLIFFP